MGDLKVGEIREWVIKNSEVVGDGRLTAYRNIDSGFALIFKDLKLDATSAIFYDQSRGLSTFWKFLADGTALFGWVAGSQVKKFENGEFNPEKIKLLSLAVDVNGDGVASWGIKWQGSSCLGLPLPSIVRDGALLATGGEGFWIDDINRDGTVRAADRPQEVFDDILSVSADILAGREWTLIAPRTEPIRGKIARTLAWKKPKLAELTRESMEMLIEVSDHKPAFVLLYGNACTECNELTPEIEKFQSLIEGNAEVYMADINELPLPVPPTEKSPIVLVVVKGTIVKAVKGMSEITTLFMDALDGKIEGVPFVG